MNRDSNRKRPNKKRPRRTPTKSRSKKCPKLGLSIIHEDRDIIVVDKPSGLLTTANDSQKTRTAYYALTDYVRKGQAKSKNRVYIVHRLDRETSGVMVFAKTPEAQRRLQDDWAGTQKRYLAVVHGKWPRSRGTIENSLVENSARQVYVTKDGSQGRRAKTGFRLIKATEFASLLEVLSITDGKHQIRVHFADAGHPIIGDRKYGPTDYRSKRIALHASSLSFRHPYSGEPCNFKSPAPGFHYGLVGGLDTESPDAPPKREKRPLPPHIAAKQTDAEPRKRPGKKERAARRTAEAAARDSNALKPKKAYKPKRAKVATEAGVDQSVQADGIGRESRPERDRGQRSSRPPTARTPRRPGAKPSTAKAAKKGGRPGKRERAAAKALKQAKAAKKSKARNRGGSGGRSPS